MRGKVVALFLFLPLITPILADDWIQDSWVDGPAPEGDWLWNQHRKSFDTSVNLAWWRYVVDPGTGDNHIFPYAPSTNPDDVGEFGDGIELMRVITCETNYFDHGSETFYQVVGGLAANGKLAIYYSDDYGVTWNENISPNLRGPLLYIAQRPDTNELHVAANTNDGLEIYILDGLDGAWDLQTEIPDATFTNARFLFDDSYHGYLTVSDTDQTDARLWLWDGNDWSTDGDKFPGDPFHLYAIWRMGHTDDLFVAVDNNVGNDLLYYSTDDGDSWSEWTVDYYGGPVDAPQFASTGPSTSGMNTYVYLATSNAHGSPLVCRINDNDPTDFYLFDFKYTGLTEVHDILVADDGIVFISGIGVGGAGLWISDDDGLSWTGNYFDDPWDDLDAVPVLLQDPNFGFIYASGNSLILETPFIVFMAHPTAEIISLPYDCGEPSTFDSIEIPVDLPENSDLKVYLRSDDTPQMNGDWVLIDNYYNLEGIEQGMRYVQYKLEFFAGNDVPYSFPVVESFRLSYNPGGDPDSPRVVETIPSDGAQGVSLNTDIWVVFSRSMDLASFEGNFFIYDGEIEIPWTGRLEGDDESTFVADPEQSLPPLKLIEVLLYEGITDSDGTPLEDDNGPAEGAYDFGFETGGSSRPDGPRVEETVPPDGAKDVPLNTNILVKFDRRMDLDSFRENFHIFADGIEIDWDGRLEGDNFEFIAEPDPGLPPRSLISVLLDFGITDEDGKPLEDGNGPEEGAYDFSFTTGGEGDIDEDPPEVTDVKANPNPTFGADVVSLTCKADDAERGGSFIAGGEYFVDDAGQDGEGMPMSAGDGDFDDSYEELLALVDASGWADGSTHILYVHARDAAGNWSPLQSVVVETEGDFFDPSRAYVWPNPASDAAHFAFTVGGDARVELVVYDLAGREVHRERGEFVVGTPGAFVWNLDGVASDVYIFRLAAEEISGMGRSGSVMKKLAVVR
ncbi:MAG TPA: Ig-like domain-containing protein [bacterium]|nr:Ig-like domain-containing protein [bacterium]